VKAEVVLEDMGVRKSSAKIRIARKYSLHAQELNYITNFVNWRIMLGKKD
jgi:hypothetical protein